MKTLERLLLLKKSKEDDDTSMNYFSIKSILLLVGFFAFYLISCNEEVKNQKIEPFNYSKIVQEIQSEKEDSVSDISNLFDKDEIDPFKDSLDEILDGIKKQMIADSLQIKKLGIHDSGILSHPSPLDTTAYKAHKDSFNTDIRKISKGEIITLKFNLEQFKKVDSLRNNISIENCKQIECRLWARIIKSKQMLYLYIDGVMVDSFKVSTGDRRHETPLFDQRPQGPLFKKYTSKKFPGGNYNGLGNMPYVVFIKGGFAIHGTTRGNITRLGRKASHGCIRLHPDHGKIFFELVKTIGITNTWISIQE